KLHNCLKLFNTATEILSKSNYLTIANLYLIISDLFNHLNAFDKVSKITAFFNPYFKQIVYLENLANEILALIYANLLVNSDSIVQPLHIS
ncbi:10421_t:CDS:2, partial [Scutellospora calospora]